tara:strand:+ start:200 stop:583 length:384 start_codon:yes stop_codon:yes gene_type:complete
MTSMPVIDENEVDALASFSSHLEILKEIDNERDDPSEDIDEDDYYEKLNSMVLSVEQKKVYEICLGTGGPGYHLTVIVDGSDHNAYIQSMTYTYLNWFYKKDIPILRHTQEWDIWHDFASNFVEEWM